MDDERLPPPAGVFGNHLRDAPKVVLHDHLDGGLRPQTVAELADETGYTGLPTTEPNRLADWFLNSADGGDLVRYLQGFEHTCAVLQTADALRRVATEFVEDLAEDGIVHAEIRFAPERHTVGGLSLDDVMEAVTDGLTSGARETGIGVGTLVTVMRSADRGVEVATLAVRWRDRGVVGLDLAGPEAGHAPADHLEAFRICHEASLPVSIHAGEAAGLDSIREALHPCGADRIGHGVRIIDDIKIGGEGAPVLGPLASYIRDRGVPLELCPTSNVHTGAATSFKDHPLPILRDLGFHVTLNTDDRLMSGITLSSEFGQAIDLWGWGLSDLEAVTIAAAEASFLPAPRRRSLIENVIKPGWAALRKDSST